MMCEHENLIKLEDIELKYERLESLISILQMFTGELVDVVGAPSDSLSNALFEIELAMRENNKELKNFIAKDGKGETWNERLKRGFVLPECTTN